MACIILNEFDSSSQGDLNQSRIEQNRCVSANVLLVKHVKVAIFLFYEHIRLLTQIQPIIPIYFLHSCPLTLLEIAYTVFYTLNFMYVYVIITVLGFPSDRKKRIVGMYPLVPRLLMIIKD